MTDPLWLSTSPGPPELLTCLLSAGCTDLRKSHNLLEQLTELRKCYIYYHMFVTKEEVPGLRYGEGGPRSSLPLSPAPPQVPVVQGFFQRRFCYTVD